MGAVTSWQKALSGAGVASSGSPTSAQTFCLASLKFSPRSHCIILLSSMTASPLNPFALKVEAPAAEIVPEGGDAHANLDASHQGAAVGRIDDVGVFDGLAGTD
uniref:Uncharacterized protein n=1 Tax=Alexandrium monilatum TaxID=311494 RepID=A0A7S4PYE4_9DINO